MAHKNKKKIAWTVEPLLYEVECIYLGTVVISVQVGQPNQSGFQYHNFLQIEQLY